MSTKLVKKDGDTLPTKPDDSILLEMVKRTDIDPDRLEKFMDLQFKMEAKQAEREFNAALSAFQGECPIIDKSRNVNFTGKSGKSVDYDYSPLEEIAAVIKPILSKHSLSYSFDVKETADKDKLQLITKIRHAAGHCEETSYFFNKYHDDDRMNSAQRAKSSVTFSKRAALENALGLITAKEDDDAGGAAGLRAASAEERIEVTKLVNETGSDLVKLLEFVKCKKLDELTVAQAKTAVHALKQKRGTNV